MLEPFSLKNALSLIERAIPVQKISAEAQKERKAVQSQTLTALGSYWKGRKPLVLVKACVLGALLPASGNVEADIAIFEKLMAMDAEGFGRRIALSSSTKLTPSAVAVALIAQGWTEGRLGEVFTALGGETLVSAAESGRLRWARRVDWEQKATLYPTALALLPFKSPDEKKPEKGWLGLADRAEQVDQEKLYTPIWPEVNTYLGTSARSMAELVEQLGVARFGKRPVVGDAFCGGGSIPFEAARLGCDVVASDLNPVACMLTWGALNIIGADASARQQIATAQEKLAAALEAKVSQLAIEHNERGDQAKAYLYCLETRCPETGYMSPLLATRVISKSRNTVAVLEPDPTNKRFEIRVKDRATTEEMAEAETGTVKDGDLLVTLDGVTHRTPIKTLRGDRRGPGGETVNNLRRWEKTDFIPGLNDIWQERLYAIQWITKETLGTLRQETYFAGVTPEDEARERKVESIVRANLADWQERGLVPDMAIEPGDETTRLGRERGWTHWHHLFGARALLIGAILQEKTGGDGALALIAARVMDWCNKLCRYGTGAARESISQLFYDQAINPLISYAIRPSWHIKRMLEEEFESYPSTSGRTLRSSAAATITDRADYWITDPPYADAIRYEEIFEFFIAWLRKNPPQPFRDWVWDSRRALAIKGTGEDFKTAMIAAYRNLANNMPDNGGQIVMFTHQDAGVWSDMAAIMWGAGLQVTAAWYVATENATEMRAGGYVQGTVLLVLRKRNAHKSSYRDEIALEIQSEVARQIESLTGLNDMALSHGRSENLFEDADLQMAGYAAALRVLTGYTQIDGEDMAAYAARPRVRGRGDLVTEIIEFAAETANGHLVPGGFPKNAWANLEPEERFYLKMADMEAAGLKKLDNYQNFAKAFRADWQPLMANASPNSARVKTANEFGKSQFGDGFGETPTRRVLWAMHQLQHEDPNSKAILEELRTTPRYYERRSDIQAIASYLGRKRDGAEGDAARTLADLIENERLD